MRRWMIFGFGLVSYLIGVAGLGLLILLTYRLRPLGVGPVALDGTAAILFNIGLVLLFAVPHAVMARAGFKQAWTRVVPEPAERACYVLQSGVLMGALVWLWQPLPRVLWSVELPALRIGLWALAGLGWAYLLAASFAIDHFELFGVAGVWRQLRSDDRPPTPFVERWMYRFDRHPIMTGVLIGLWSVPLMCLDGLLLAVALTAYVIVGVAMEERDLVRAHGDDYRSYRQRVWTVVPPLGARG